MSDKIEDRETGISIRFVRQWNVSTDKMPARFDVEVDEHTAAQYLATQDKRDIPFAVKVADALTYLREMRVDDAVAAFPQPQRGDK